MESRWVDVAPGRLAVWLEQFEQRHGPAKIEPGAGLLTVVAEDGSRAECHTPFPANGVIASAEHLTANATADRTVGVLLVRLGGYAAGVFAGAGPRLIASKVGARLVHGRSAAGGTSQQRFARRREKQASEALSAAADCAAGVFGPHRLDAVVLGGDRRAMAKVRADPRLRRYFALAVDRFLTVPDPRLAVLRETPRRFRAIRVRLTEEPGGGRGADTDTASPGR